MMGEMGYTCQLDEHYKYWTIKGKDWGRAKRLYRLGENYTNEKILERINQNSYGVKFSSFPNPKEEKTYRVKGDFGKVKKVGGLRGLYFHYCYQLGILPKKRENNYTRVHYLLRADLMKMDTIIQETRLLCQKRFETAEQLFLYKETLQTDMRALIEQRKKLYAKSRRCENLDEKDEIRAELTDISKRLQSIRKEVKLCQGILDRSEGIKEKLQVIRTEERREIRNEHRRGRSRADR